MARITVYIPDDVERELRKRAKRVGGSLSSFVAGLIRSQGLTRGWPDEFIGLFGSWEGSFPVPEDSPPDDVRFVARWSRSQRPR